MALSLETSKGIILRTGVHELKNTSPFAKVVNGKATIKELP